MDFILSKLQGRAGDSVSRSPESSSGRAGGEPAGHRRGAGRILSGKRHEPVGGAYRRRRLFGRSRVGPVDGRRNGSDSPRHRAEVAFDSDAGSGGFEHRQGRFRALHAQRNLRATAVNRERHARADR